MRLCSACNRRTTDALNDDNDGGDDDSYILHHQWRSRRSVAVLTASRHFCPSEAVHQKAVSSPLLSGRRSASVIVRIIQVFSGGPCLRLQSGGGRSNAAVRTPW